MYNKEIIIAGALMIVSLAGCSLFGSSSPPSIPQPPVNLDSNNQPLILPQIGNSTQQNIAESTAAKQQESQPSPFKTITENRGPGGTVTKITVDNPGRMPDYYLTPNIQQQTDTNNNPDKLSTPNWQWSW
jgi:hypothetical protein